VADWEEGERLANEKDVLGFFVSGHPLDKYAEKLRNLAGVISVAEALERSRRRGAGHAGGPGRRDSGGGNDSRVARAEKQADQKLYAQAALKMQRARST